MFGASEVGFRITAEQEDSSTKTVGRRRQCGFRHIDIVDSDCLQTIEWRSGYTKPLCSGSATIAMTKSGEQRGQCKTRPIKSLGAHCDLLSECPGGNAEGNLKTLNNNPDGDTPKPKRPSIIDEWRIRAFTESSNECAVRTGKTQRKKKN